MAPALRLTFTALIALLAVPAALPPPRAEAAFPGRNGRIAFTSERDGNREIYVVNADGTGLLNLTNSPAAEGRPEWSADGARIAFERDGALWIMAADGTDQALVTEDGLSPTWSPDGLRLAFAATRGGNTDIYSIRADGLDETRLTDDPAFDGFPAWSPDGSTIIFDSQRTGTRDIWAMAPDGTGQIDLTPETGTQVFADWSPDGAMIALQYGAPFDVYVMDAGGGGLHQVIASQGFDGEPAWSPAGDMIAFGTNRDGDEEIYIASADGSAQVNLTNSPERDAEADWQPLGARGDADCDGDVDAVDALQNLRAVAGLSANACVNWGNVRCDNPLDAVDGLLILRHVAALPVNLPPACPEIGT